MELVEVQNDEIVIAVCGSHTSENGALTITLPDELRGWLSSAASLFINWHLPLQCIAGLLRFSQRFFAMYSLFMLYSATINHLLKVWVSSKNTNSDTAINFTLQRCTRLLKYFLF